MKTNTGGHSGRTQKGGHSERDPEYLMLKQLTNYYERYIVLIYKIFGRLCLLIFFHLLLARLERPRLIGRSGYSIAKEQ